MKKFRPAKVEELWWQLRANFVISCNKFMSRACGSFAQVFAFALYEELYFVYPTLNWTCFRSFVHFTTSISYGLSIGSEVKDLFVDLYTKKIWSVKSTSSLIPLTDLIASSQAWRALDPVQMVAFTCYAILWDRLKLEVLQCLNTLYSTYRRQPL